jgi:hypothetical protein
MSDQNETVREDIAFLRNLAEAGRTGNMAGGEILLCAGLIYGVASFVTAWCMQAGLVTSGLFMPIVWFGATALFLLCLFMLKASAQERSSGAAGAAGAAFSSAGLSIFFIIVSLMLIGYRANAWMVMSASAPVIVAIYGGCWWLAAVLTKIRWLYVIAYGSFAAGLAMAWFSTEPPMQFAIYGVTLLLLLAAPGFAFMRKSKAA